MDSDGGAFSSAKLREHVLGRLQKENDDLYSHTGMVKPGSSAEELLSFWEALDLERDLGVPIGESRAGRIIRRGAATRHVGAAVADVPSYAVGITDQDVEISEVKAMTKLARSLLNEGAPYIGLCFGAPNRGKTGFVALQAELWAELIETKYGRDDGLIVSNLEAPFVDEVVRDFASWRDLVLGDEEFVASGGRRGEPPAIEPDRPVWWLFDECSTHLDAHNQSTRHAVETSYLPALKRFAKVRVDCSHVGHSTLDVHKEIRRDNICTEVVVKAGLKVANVFEHATEFPAEQKYQLLEVPESSWTYDPDDYSPWAWE